MESELDIHHYTSMPYVIVHGKKVIEVGYSFLDFTGYRKAEILGQDIEYIFEKLLKLSLDLNDINESGKSFFMFTKGHEPREVTIIIRNVQYFDRNLLVFIEKPNSRIDDACLILNRFMQDSDVGVALYSAPDFILLKVNQIYLNSLYSAINTAENVIGMSVKTFMPGWNGSRAEKAFVEAVEKNQTLHFKERKGLLGYPDERYWNNDLIPIDTNGNVKYLISVLEDVTEKVEQRKKVEKYASQLKLISEKMTDALFIINADGSYDYLNKRAYDMAYQAEKIKIHGESLLHTKYYDENGKELAEEELPGSRVVKGETIDNVVLKACRPDKVTYLNFYGSPIYNENGELTSAILCIRDISEKYRYELEIKEQKEELEAIVENMSDGLAVVDRNGNYIRVNKKVRERIEESTQMGKAVDKLGKSLEMGEEYYDISGKELSLEDFPAAKVIKGEYIKNQRVVLKRGDRTFYYDFSASPIFDDNGVFRLGIIHNHDVTELIENEQIIRKQQQLLLESEKAEKEALEKAMKMKDEFFATITHEFKTPLTVINAAIQAMESIYGSQLTDSIKKYLQRIRVNSFRQLRLVNNILDLSKYNAGRIKLNKDNYDIVLLTRAITQSVKIYAKQKEINLIFSSDIECKEIGIDEEKYERILLNLLSNAIKFTPNGKSIYVHVACIDKKVIITVKDEGVGIPKNKQKSIFKRFGQAETELTKQAEGTGIGLSLVKSLVTALGGTIELKSKVGEGSIFTITFPTSKAKSKFRLPSAETTDSRIMKAAEIEFSQIYMD